MDFLHAAIMNFVISATLFFFIGMLAMIPNAVLGIVYLIAYLKNRNKSPRCQK